MVASCEENLESLVGFIIVFIFHITNAALTLTPSFFVTAKEAFVKPIITTEQTARILQAQNVPDRSFKGI